MIADWKRKRPLTDARCPTCGETVSLPAKNHPTRADIRCPHCRAELTATMGGMAPKVVAKSAI